MGLSLYLPWWTLPIALVALCFVAGRQHDCRLKGTAVTLMMNWCTCTAVVIYTDDPYPVAAFATFDYLCALYVVLMIPLGRGDRSRWQTMIGLLYAAEFIVHGAVAWTEYYSPAAARGADFYGYHTIYMLAWAQVVVIATWGGNALVHRYRLRRGSVAHHQPVPARIRHRR